MSDGKYFQTTRKGEVYELKSEIHDHRLDKKKDAVKKVIAAMTVGKDMSNLFPDVVQCLHSTNLEMKKLTYLYLINYAKAQPELVILAINTLRKECQDSSPLLRALACRTMGCIRSEEILEYVTEPLRKCLRDSSAYVRKTAATCVAKVYSLNPDLCEEQGFVEYLQEMLSDANPGVVANAIAALAEIDENLIVNDTMVAKLLIALNDCDEWSQIYLLDNLSRYRAENEEDAEALVDRLTARLSHANPAVAVSACRCILNQIDFISNPEVMEHIFSKIRPCLVTLLSSNDEILYAILRNVNLVIKRYPSLLANEVKSLFVKYNDPLYLKIEKIEAMLSLCNDDNLESLRREFTEYASSVDIEFTRHAILGLGQLAMRSESAGEACLETLCELMQLATPIIVETAVIVLKNILRQYPGSHENVLRAMCENVEYLDDVQAKSAFIWIIGEYCAEIEQSEKILEQYVETFKDEDFFVQQQVLTACVKFYLRLPHNSDLVLMVLQLARQSQDFDLRDRAMFYWRLLSEPKIDPNQVKRMLLKPKPKLDLSRNCLSSAELGFLRQFGSVASIYHKPVDGGMSQSDIPEMSNSSLNFTEPKIDAVECVKQVDLLDF